MSIPTIKLKVRRKSVIKGKALVRFPANVLTDNFLTVTRENGTYTFSVDYTKLTPGPIEDPSGTFIAVLDAIAGVYKFIPLSDITNGTGTGAVRIVTEAGDITVGPNTRVLVMNRIANESPSKVNLPASALKVGDIKIVDFKGNAGSFPHDVYPSGAEKFNGGLSSWQIGADGASLVFDPVPTLGYAV